MSEVMIAETDHCCAGFQKADGWLRAAELQREGRVGHADARLCDARDLVAVAVERLRDEPLMFLSAPSAGYDECDLARASCA